MTNDRKEALDLLKKLPEPAVKMALIYLKYIDITKLDKSPKNTKTPKYTLTDLAGKLQWRGNPLAIQKKLRNEW